MLSVFLHVRTVPMLSYNLVIVTKRMIFKMVHISLIAIFRRLVESIGGSYQLMEQKSKVTQKNACGIAYISLKKLNTFSYVYYLYSKFECSRRKYDKSALLPLLLLL